jgi:hypothetical protein
MFSRITSLLFILSLSSLVVCSPAFSQDADTNSAPQVVPPTGPDNPTILPPHPESVGGGNPFQGLGRPDDTGPARWTQFLKPDGTALISADQTNGTGQTNAVGQSNTTGQTSATGQTNTNALATPSSEDKPIETVPKLPAELTGEAGREIKEDATKEGLLKEKENSGAGNSESAFEKKEEAKKEEGLKAAKIEKDSPMRRALNALQTGHYEEALAKLKALSTQNASDAQVHYLLAVTNVMLRRFPEASSQYKLAAKLAGPGSHLAELAEEGLRKLALERFGSNAVAR